MSYVSICEGLRLGGGGGGGWVSPGYVSAAQAPPLPAPSPSSFHLTSTIDLPNDLSLLEPSTLALFYDHNISIVFSEAKNYLLTTNFLILLFHSYISQIGSPEKHHDVAQDNTRLR